MPPDPPDRLLLFPSALLSFCHHEQTLPHAVLKLTASEMHACGMRHAPSSRNHLFQQVLLHVCGARGGRFAFVSFFSSSMRSSSSSVSDASPARLAMRFQSRRQDPLGPCGATPGVSATDSQPQSMVLQSSTTHVLGKLLCPVPDHPQSIGLLAGRNSQVRSVACAETISLVHPDRLVPPGTRSPLRTQPASLHQPWMNTHWLSRRLRSGEEVPVLFGKGALPPLWRFRPGHLFTSQPMQGLSWDIDLRVPIKKLGGSKTLGCEVPLPISPHRATPFGVSRRMGAGACLSSGNLAIEVKRSRLRQAKPRTAATVGQRVRLCSLKRQVSGFFKIRHWLGVRSPRSVEGIQW